MDRFGFFQYLRLKLIAVLMRMAARLRTALTPKPVLPEGVERELIRMPSRDKSRFIDAWVYRPSTSSTSTTTQPSPVLLNWHGSAMVMPQLGSDLVWCAQVVLQLGIAVVDADYRKSPENPFPAAIEDAEDALAWIEARPRQFDLGRVAVSGFSSGGNMALVAASTIAKDHHAVDVRAAVAFYPGGTDWSIPPEEKIVAKPIRPLPRSIDRFIRAAYLPEESLYKDPRASPALTSKDLFPKNMIIFTCSGDVFAPEGNRLAEALDDGTRRVTHQEIPHTPHGFDKLCKEGDEMSILRNSAYEKAIKSLGEALA
jgi:acetyl esterase/lipase